MKKILLTASLLVTISMHTQASNKVASLEAGNNAMNNKPLLFMENKGQIIDDKGNPRPDVLFTTEGRGTKLFFNKNGISYQFVRHTAEKEVSSISKFPVEQTKSKGITCRMDMQLQGANPQPEIVKQDKSTYYENYYMPNCNGGKGITDVGAYEKVTYKNIYPKIDWVIFSKGHTMEYDFVVHPGGNPDDIKMTYTQPKSIDKNEDGSVTVNSLLGKITEQKPFTYQDAKKEIVSSFIITENTLAFNVDNYNKQKDLIIDPGLIWSTYFGGTGVEGGAFNLLLDDSGNSYLYGATESTTLGNGINYTQSDSMSGGFDAFIAKMDANSNLLWATYYGGSLYEFPRKLQFGSTANQNQIVVVGYTNSNDLPTLLGFQSTKTGTGTDGFIARFGANGYLQKASYLGDNSNTCYLNGLATDAAGNIYLAGGSSSFNYMAYGNSYQATNPGGLTGFLMKLDSNWIRQWGTYVGGSDADYFNAVAINNSDQLFAGGRTLSPGIAVNDNTPYAQGGGDALLAWFDTAGNVKTIRYFGGNGDEVINDLVVNSDPQFQNYFAICGSTTSTNLTSVGCEKCFNGGGQDAFFAQFYLFYNNGVTYLANSYSDYLGGTNLEDGLGIAFNKEDLYFVGQTLSPSGISKNNGYQMIGSDDGFLVHYGAYNGGFNYGVIWSSYFGGTIPNIGTFESLGAVVVNPNYNANYIATAGNFNSPNLCNNCANPNWNGTDDAGVAIFAKDCNSTPNPLKITSSSGIDEICAGNNLTLNVSGATNYVWTGNVTGNSLLVNSENTYTVTGTAFGCPFTASKFIKLNALPIVTIAPSGSQFICQGSSLDLHALATLNDTVGIGNYKWYKDGTFIQGATDSIYYASTSGSYAVEVTNASNCSKTSFAVLLAVNNAPPASINIPPTTSFCVGSSINLKANNAVATYQWYLNGNPISGATSNAYNASATGDYTVKETSPAPYSCDSISNTISLTFYPYPNDTITYTGEPYTCIGGTVTLYASTDVGLTYQWKLNGVDIPGQTSNQYTATQSGSYTCVHTNSGNCASTSAAVVINPIPEPQQICLVTVDSLSQFNQVIWEKPISTTIDSFRIYREDITNIYKYVASIGYSQLSLYIDTDLANANPNAVTKRYKMATVDICGQVSTLSNYHNTIYQQDNGLGTFNWNTYTIENTANPVNSYILYRNDASTGNVWLPQASTAGTQNSVTYTNFFTYPNSQYRIETNWGISCTPSAKIMAGFNTSRSNVKNKSVGVKAVSMHASKIILLPNPASNFVQVLNTSQEKISSIHIIDNLGRVVMLLNNFNREKDAISIDISQLLPAVYSVRIETTTSVIIKKFVKN